MQSYHHSIIQSGKDFRETIRAGSYAWPGGYPLYFITADGAALSFETAKREAGLIIDAIRRKDRSGGWQVVACQVNWEDPSLFCDHTGERIESAYAEELVA